MVRQFTFLWSIILKRYAENKYMPLTKGIFVRTYKEQASRM